MGKNEKLEDGGIVHKPKMGEAKFGIFKIGSSSVDPFKELKGL